MVFPVIQRTVRPINHHEPLFMFSGRDDVEGDPDSHCLHVLLGGAFRFRIPIDEGTRRVKIRCKDESTKLQRPELIIHENAEIGLLQELRVGAQVGSGWVTIGPITFTATKRGGVLTLQRLFGITHSARGGSA